MIIERTSRRFSGAAALSAILCAGLASHATAQTGTPASRTRSVASNPRSGPDDPRIGLKGGLYDAGEAAFGLQRIASLPKPPGFAPGDTAGPPVPVTTDSSENQGRQGPPPVQYGSTNSD